MLARQPQPGSSGYSVQSEKSRDERGRATFQIDAKFVDCTVAAKIVLIKATERPQEGAQARPQPFEGVGMHLPDAVAVIIPRPFIAAVTNGGLRTKDRRIAVRLIGEQDSARPRAAMDGATQGFGFGIGFDPHTNLAGGASHHPNNRRTVIGIATASAALVSSTARWVSRVTRRPAFFPPHSETFRHFRFAYPARRLWAATVQPALAARGARLAAPRSQRPIPVIARRLARL